MVHFDGQRHFSLDNDWVIVRRTKNAIKLLHPLGHSYYDTLPRQKYTGARNERSLCLTF